MAVPKKKTSRSKRDIRRKAWERKLTKQILFAFAIGKIYLSKKDNTYVFPSNFKL